MNANGIFPICNSMGQIIPVILVTGKNKSGKTTFLWELSRRLGVPLFNHHTRANVFQNFHTLVMMVDPKKRILLCDEIDWGMDAAEVRGLWRNFTKIAEDNKLQIIMASHSAELRQLAAEDNARFSIESMWERYNSAFPSGSLPE